VEASTSHNPTCLHGLLQGWLYMYKCIVYICMCKCNIGISDTLFVLIILATNEYYAFTTLMLSCTICSYPSKCRVQRKANSEAAHPCYAKMKLFTLVPIHILRRHRSTKILRLLCQFRACYLHNLPRNHDVGAHHMNSWHHFVLKDYCDPGKMN
jgi:hypothetical protein